MSFWPLPTSLAEELREGASRGPCLELGAGEGEFAARLVQLGLAPLLLDRRDLPPGLRPRVRADLLELPLRPGSVGLLVLGNTLRQVPEPLWPRLAHQAWQAMRPGGRFVVLEDEPRALDEAEACYRTTLELLDRAQPGRGIAVDAAQAERSLAGVWGAPSLSVCAENETKIRDPLAPLRWLRQSGKVERAELDRLEEKVKSFGMRYGRFWARVFGGEAR